MGSEEISKRARDNNKQCPLCLVADAERICRNNCICRKNCIPLECACCIKEDHLQLRFGTDQCFMMT